MVFTAPSSPTLEIFNTEDGITNAIVNADIIEAVKENIQPLQKGRRATALSAIFSTPHAQRDALLSRQRACFRLQLTQAFEGSDDNKDDIDPLDVYTRFVAWTLESYPQGQSTESGLLELLEEATRKLKDTENYKQDSRYLNLWSLYAGYVDKPHVIYAYLLANEIGTNLAQLYEEYAYFRERDGRCKEADEMYSLGIARKAEPLDRLKRRYADFQRRMLAAPLPTSASPPRPVGPPTAGRRTVLGVSAGSQLSHSVSTPMEDVFSTPQPNARLQIFVDPIGAAAQRAEGNAWPDLGTRASRSKENAAEIHKMGETSLPRSANRLIPLRDPPARGAFIPFMDGGDTAAMPPPSAPVSSRRIAPTSRSELFQVQIPETPRPSFMPYQDETVQQTPGRVNIVSTPTSLIPRPKQGTTASEAEALRKDPFKNYDVRPVADIPEI